MLRRRGRSGETKREVSELHERRQELVRQLIVNERYAARLDDLSDRHCVALAAAAAERIVPLYEMFQREEQWGDYDFLRRGLDSVWAVLAGEASPDGLRGLSGQGEKATVPDLGGEERWKSDWVGEAEDAAISVLVTMDAAADDDRENAVHAVQYEIDVLDNYIARSTSVEHTKPRPQGDTLVHALKEAVEREERTLEHPLMKEVVQLIERDLETLERADHLSPETVRALRSTAERNSVVDRIERK
jgi:uncharacterized protein YjaG (DUF416 family)